MASIHGLACFVNPELSYSCSSSRHVFHVSPVCRNFAVNSCSMVPISILKTQAPNRGRVREIRLLKAVELDRLIISDDEEEDEISEGYFEAIEELERMTREPSDVLEEMNSRLSARELQLVLIYFSQEGRDSWCALEVFEWLKKENKVDKETMELMVSIMCSWAKKMIESKGEVGEVVDLLVDMDCVGLKPSFSMIEKVISLYWELNEKDKGILFVKEVLRREIGYEEAERGKAGGPVGYLAWKMMSSGSAMQIEDVCTHFAAIVSFFGAMIATSKAICSSILFLYLHVFTQTLLLIAEDPIPHACTFLSGFMSELLNDMFSLISRIVKPIVGEEDGNYRDALKLVIHFRESGLKPDVYSYLIAMRAVVEELNDLAKALRKLRGFTRTGLMTELDVEDTKLIKEYQSDIVGDGVNLSNWVIEEGDSSLYGVVHERLLAMYIYAGYGLEAERQLWEMKLAGKEADANLYDIVLAICASRKEEKATARLLARMEFTGLLRKKKTLTWLLRGYMKGSHYIDAAETAIKMLDLGLWPEYLDRVAVMHELLKRIQQPGNLKTYLKLCKSLSDKGLIVNCLTYLYIKKYNMWVIETL